ncbi:PREDICTED: uncharacterized protein LOC109464993 [Branchiostoma belcheri]|uniref:Uncharacterized protein LOC109464993 n=1 Tax=Branchiostoma belcheri TaxID=7741 RepID=A0A6P4XM23_BRABE|nr:PREDICTED: uncharacterized protein LOC109464993 [Branchiostoma belcheri]
MSKVFEVPGVAVEDVFAEGRGADFHIPPQTLTQQDRDRYCGSTYLGLLPSQLNNLAGVCDADGQVGNTCYALFNELKTYQEAKRSCRNKGGALALADRDTIQAFKNQLSSYLQSRWLQWEYWIGVDNLNGTLEFVEWDDATTAVDEGVNDGWHDSGWGNDSSVQPTCVSLVSSWHTYVWKATDCTRRAAYMCQFDTGGSDGGSDRAASKPVILQCNGDYLAIYDGSGVVSLGTNQEFLYGDIEANVTLDLRIRNMHADDLPSTAPGSENFRIEVWVAETADPLSDSNTMVEVTKEVHYPPEAYHPLVAGDSVWLRNVIVTVDADKLTGAVARDVGSGRPANFLVVKLIAGNNVNEEVIGNNFVAHNLTGKIVPMTRPVENIDLEVLSFCITDIIRCDTQSAVSILAHIRAKVNDPNALKLTSYGLDKSYAVNVYLSFDDVYDPSEDLDSRLTTAALGVPAEYGQEAIHSIDQQMTMQIPSDPRYCSRLWAIMTVHMVEVVDLTVRQEPLLYNNYVAYPVVVQCISQDVYGISNLVLSATTIYQDVATPVTLTFDLACTQVDCSIPLPTDVQDTNYNIYIYAENTTDLTRPFKRSLLQRIDSTDWSGEGGGS